MGIATTAGWSATGGGFDDVEIGLEQATKNQDVSATRLRTDREMLFGLDTASLYLFQIYRSDEAKRPAEFVHYHAHATDGRVLDGF